MLFAILCAHLRVKNRHITNIVYKLIFKLIEPLKILLASVKPIFIFVGRKQLNLLNINQL
jgi:hypothetical protein